jgi:hypothetical protein
MGIEQSKRLSTTLDVAVAELRRVVRELDRVQADAGVLTLAQGQVAQAAGWADGAASDIRSFDALVSQPLTSRSQRRSVLISATPRTLLSDKPLGRGQRRRTW